MIVSNLKVTKFVCHPLKRQTLSDFLTFFKCHFYIEEQKVMSIPY